MPDNVHSIPHPTDKVYQTGYRQGCYRAAHDALNQAYCTSMNPDERSKLMDIMRDLLMIMEV